MRRCLQQNGQGDYSCIRIVSWDLTCLRSTVINVEYMYGSRLVALRLTRKGPRKQSTDIVHQSLFEDSQVYRYISCLSTQWVKRPAKVVLNIWSLRLSLSLPLPLCLKIKLDDSISKSSFSNEASLAIPTECDAFFRTQKKCHSDQHESLW